MNIHSLKALTWQRADESVHVLHVPRAGVSRQEARQEGGEVVAVASPPLLQALGGGGGAGTGRRLRSVERVNRVASEIRTLRCPADEARRGKNARRRFPLEDRRLPRRSSFVFKFKVNTKTAGGWCSPYM